MAKRGEEGRRECASRKIQQKCRKRGWWWGGGTRGSRRTPPPRRPCATSRLSRGPRAPGHPRRGAPRRQSRRAPHRGHTTPATSGVVSPHLDSPHLVCRSTCTPPSKAYSTDSRSHHTCNLLVATHLPRDVLSAYAGCSPPMQGALRICRVLSVCDGCSLLMDVICRCR